MIKIRVAIFEIMFALSLCGLLTAGSDNRFPGYLVEDDIMVDFEDDLWDRDHGLLVDMKEGRWPSGVVPYDFNVTNYNAYDQHVIRVALSEIEKGTCIKFIRRTNELHYINVVPMGGCWSYRGMQDTAQVLSLESPHCIDKGTVMHEFMHALGFWHEHSRSDRDEYVDIIWENVAIAEKQENFAKAFPEPRNFPFMPYDYRSVMHYEAYAFSKSPRLPTIRPKKANVRLRDLGRAKMIGVLTPTDREKLNMLYECRLPK